MNLLEAWRQSVVDTASIDHYGLVISITCTEETLTVVIGNSDARQLSAKDVSRLLQILDIDPDKGWNPV